MRFRFALFTTALAAASMLLAPPAQASTSKLSKSDLAFVTDSSQRLGIPPLVRESLIAKLEQGLVPESMTGSLPTKTDTSISPERMVTRKEFADGSVSQTTFQLPATQSKKSVGGAVVTPLSVTGCGDSPGVGTFAFQGCTVRTDQFSFTLAFEADGYLGTNCSFPGSISRIYGAWYSGIGATGGISQEILQQYQNCNSPARARASALVTYNVGPVPYSFTASLTFYVQNGSRWDTSP